MLEVPHRRRCAANALSLASVPKADVGRSRANSRTAASGSPARAPRPALVRFVELVFLLSGAAALVYQVVWTRSLGLVFGSSHLAVTTVLSVFMGGLALGGSLFGRRARAGLRPLRLYGLLELGIAASAIVFALLVRVYPVLYVPLARLGEGSPLYLSILRVGFAAILLIVPTTLMGGTLPVLAAFVGGRGRVFAARLSLLYAVNTLGAVLGAGAAGFLLLRFLSVSASLAVAIGVNLLLGVACLAVDRRAGGAGAAATPVAEPTPVDAPSREPGTPALAGRLVLVGAGVCGFCALGYEVLWTRVLGMVIGASVYGFTVMLMAFLTGIALGSAAFGAWHRRRARDADGGEAPVLGFALVLLAIGAAGLAVTGALRALPARAYALQWALLGAPATTFATRQAIDFLLAFLYLLVPAFLSGLAFPLAVRIRAQRGGEPARAVGETLAVNTLGAIAGSALSGFVLVHLVGIERSLQLLSLAVAGWGLVVAAGMRGPRLAAAAGAAVAGAALLLAGAGDALRLWDPRYFAVYQSNRPDKFATPEKTRDTLRNTDVLHYAEGVQATVSSIRVKGGTQSFVTNGRIEATDNPPDLACQYTLGHLPMLLHPEPRNVFVLGTGSGMTLGATSVHPAVERLTLAEIEPAVLGVARTFARYNHDVLDDPRLRVEFNDGRNFLLTTRERFDVITADPIHPWFSGAGYLYTKQYFDLAASRLAPGGVMCQWLPIYELDGADLRSIVRTFRSSFAHVLVWLTHYDAHLVGSDAPFRIDERELERRIAVPAVRDDLRRVEMGSARDLLAFFVFGTAGVDAYAAGARINTDDNLYLEFSAPLSIESSGLVAENFGGLVAHRESLLPYLAPADGQERSRQEARSSAALSAARIADPIRHRELAGEIGLAEAARLTAELGPALEDYGPWRYLVGEFARDRAQAPRLLRQVLLPAVKPGGAVEPIRLGAVARRMTEVITTLDFVDGRDGRVFAHHQILGGPEAAAVELVEAAFRDVQVAYAAELRAASARGEPAPAEARLFERLDAVLGSRLAGTDDAGLLVR